MANWIIEHNKKFAPADMVDLGRVLLRECKGIKGFAKMFASMLKDDKLNAQTRVAVMNTAITLLGKSAEAQPPRRNVTDMTTEQLVSALKLIQNVNTEDASKLDDPGDAFGA